MNTEMLHTAPETEPERQYFYIDALKKLVKEKEDKAGRKLTYHIETYGCQMNARDSEKLSGVLDMIGYEDSDTEEADFVIYNTCSIRENANDKVYGHLGRMSVIKKHNPSMMVAICGCMMQEPDEIEKIQTKYKFVDIVFGTCNLFKFAELIFHRMNSDKMIIDIWKDTNQIVENLPNTRKYPFKTGVNITYGCNNFCTFCIVPYVRGREKSREPKEIIHEIRNFVADGVKEVMLLGQNVNSYGKGLNPPVNFKMLLEEVCKVEGLERIRFMTPYPKEFTDDLIELIRDNPKICRQIHLPLQSGSTRILKKMNRQYTKDSYLELANKIKAAIPDVALTTDIIVGFPGETDEDFEDTLDVVRQVEYDSAFTFIYSKRVGTPAAKMEEQVPDEVSKERFDKLLAAVSEGAKKRCGIDVGRVMPVLVEEINTKSPDMVTGRLSNNVLVHFQGDKSLIGKIINVRLNESKGFYYIGERVAQEEE